MSDNILPTTFTAALDSFLLAKESEGVSPRTLFTYKCALTRFTSWLCSHDVASPTAITPGLVRAYFADLHKHGYTVHTVHDYARPVKTLLRFWHFDGLISVDVMARVKMPPTDKKVLPALTEAEVSRLLAACDSPRNCGLALNFVTLTLNSIGIVSL